MRAVVQRCAAARVRAASDGGVSGEPPQPVPARPGAERTWRITGEIGPGLVAFVGVGQGDGSGDVRYLAEKLAGLRVFPDERGRMALPGTACLLVPNFTLYGDVRRGRRPDFNQAAPPEVARALFDQLVEAVRAMGLTVATGEFGAHMEVEVRGDGPVTLLLDSRRQF